MRAAARAFPGAREIAGVEYQRDRFATALADLGAFDPRISIDFADAYALDFRAKAWQAGGTLAVIGNPPWVTAAALGKLASDAPQPPRSNPKRLRGLAAQTGAANFDVAEFLLLKLLTELAEAPLELALLVKESVARNVLAATRSLGVGLAAAEIVRIDARRWFGVAVDACCLFATISPTPREVRVLVRPDFGAEPLGTYDPFAQPQPDAAIAWRQGIKHDAAAVFELCAAADGWHNGFGDRIDVEDAYVYPLQKARQLHAGSQERSTALIVPQMRLNESTAPLRERAPKLHAYLHAHAQRLAARKSSIYRGAPPFAVFGIGPYSFARWKVAVAGFYAEPRFRLLGPVDGRPVMLGDTAYFVPFEAEGPARAFADLCRSGPVSAAIAACAVRGKRPITKHLLDRIDWMGFTQAGGEAASQP
ncbi:MAG: class I SAM-dependent methyltransferase [Candidatus Velthaea sp.]